MTDSRWDHIPEPGRSHIKVAEETINTIHMRYADMIAHKTTATASIQPRPLSSDERYQLNRQMWLETEPFYRMISDIASRYPRPVILKL